MECDHSKIQCIRRGRRYVWSCALCGDVMLKWSQKVWDTLFEDMPELEDGEGFTFRIVEGGIDEPERLVA